MYVTEVRSSDLLETSQGLLVSEASDLGWRGTPDRFVLVGKLSQPVEFRLSYVSRDGDGDVEFWDFRSVNEFVDFKVRVYND